MKNDSGRPRKVRIKHGGRRHPKSGRPSWTRKDNYGKRGGQRVWFEIQRDLAA